MYFYKKKKVACCSAKWGWSYSSGSVHNFVSLPYPDLVVSLYRPDGLHALAPSVGRILFWILPRVCYGSQGVIGLFDLKQDGVGPVDNRPSTNKLNHFVPKNVPCYLWHVTHDMLHMTCDMLHVACNMWHMTCYTWCGVNILSNFHFLSSYG